MICNNCFYVLKEGERSCPNCKTKDYLRPLEKDEKKILKLREML